MLIRDEVGRINYIAVALLLLNGEPPTFENLREKIKATYILVLENPHKDGFKARMDCSGIQTLMINYFNFTEAEIDEISTKYYKSCK